MHIKVLYN